LLLLTLTSIKETRHSINIDFTHFSCLCIHSFRLLSLFLKIKKRLMISPCCLCVYVIMRLIHMWHDAWKLEQCIAVLLLSN
jgi:hypothetical protein